MAQLSPPKPGDQFEYRVVGHTLPTVQNGKRQVKWEDNTSSHTDHPDILSYEPNQRFECMVRYTYTGTNPKDPFEMTGPVLLHPKKLDPHVHDPAKSKELWDKIMARNPPVTPEPAEVDEEFWLGKKEPENE